MSVTVEIVPFEGIFRRDYAGRMSDEEIRAHGELVTELDDLFTDVSHRCYSREGDYDREEVVAPVQGELAFLGDFSEQATAAIDLFDRLTRIQYEGETVAYEIVDPQEVWLKPVLAEVPRFKRPRLKWLNKFVTGDAMLVSFEPQKICGPTIVVTPEFTVELGEGQPQALTEEDMKAVSSFVRSIDQVKDVHLGQLHPRRSEDRMKLTQCHAGTV